MRQLFQFLNAPVDIAPFDFRRAHETEAFAAEGRDDAAIDHGAADIVID